MLDPCARFGACLIAVAAALAPGCRSGAGKTPPVGIKAHRGASAEAPENTVAAATLAWRQGADAVEIDVRLSADRVPVVIHDETTERTGGRDRPVAAQTVAELRELDVGSWKGPSFAGERIPTLAEIIAVVPEGRVLFVEIKVGRDQLAPILEVIEATPCRGRVVVESSRLALLRELGRAAPSIPRHWTLHARRARLGFEPHSRAAIETAVAEGLDGLALDARGLRRDFATEAARAGLEVGAWTVDNAEVAVELAGYGLRWIETNRPAAIAAALDR